MQHRRIRQLPAVHKQRGFSIMEMVLAMSVFAGMSALMLQYTSTVSSKQSGAQRAEHLVTFEQLAAKYVNDYRDNFLQAVKATSASDAAVQAHCVVFVRNPNAPVNPGTRPGRAGRNGTLAWSRNKHTCAFDASLLDAVGMWPDAQITRNDPETGGAWRYAMIVKQVIQPGPDRVLGTSDDVATDNMEALVVRMDEDGRLQATRTPWNKDARRRQIVESTVSTLGQMGGYIPIGNAGFCKAVRSGVVEICGNGWKANLNDFVDTTYLNRLRSALPAS